VALATMPTMPRPDDRDEPAPRNRPVGLKQPNHKLQPAEVDALVAAYETGTAIDGLARDFTLYHQTVRYHLKRRGVAIRPQAVLTPEQAEQVVAAYGAGQSLRQLATEFDTTYSSIRNCLLRAGVTQGVGKVVILGVSVGDTPVMV
jgi:hypothetical protein